MGGGILVGATPTPWTSFRRSARYQKCGPYMAGFPGPLTAYYGRVLFKL